MNKPMLAVDSIILMEDNSFVLIKRKNPPFKGLFALPGGMVEYGETVEQAIIREVKEETGLEVKIEKISGVYSDPNRDPRGHVVSIVFICKKIGGELKPGSDATEAKIFKKIPEKLGFDHEKILKDAGY